MRADQPMESQLQQFTRETYYKLTREGLTFQKMSDKDLSRYQIGLILYKYHPRHLKAVEMALELRHQQKITKRLQKVSQEKREKFYREWEIQKKRLFQQLEKELNQKITRTAERSSLQKPPKQKSINNKLSRCLDSLLSPISSLLKYLQTKYQQYSSKSESQKTNHKKGYSKLNTQEDAESQFKKSSYAFDKAQKNNVKKNSKRKKNK